VQVNALQPELESDAPRGGLRSRLRLEVRARPSRSVSQEIAIGLAAALIAVAVRALLPLPPDVLPVVTVVIAIAVVTPFVGVRAGVTIAIVGGSACWYLFFNPDSWSLDSGAWIPLLGFAVIAAVIISTAHLYRRTERMLHQREVEALEEQAANAQLFAREMAHRLKNALAIVQAIAFQTLGEERPETTNFAGRLKALALANDLLSEHVSKPVARVEEVIHAALEPFFSAERERVRVQSIEALIPAQQVVSLALALHELATNAVKYGALSSPEGEVELSIEDVGERLQLHWIERGGPKVELPVKRGFGTRLLRRTGMHTELEFAEDGLRCAFGIRKV
jgi:two-component sensor histidine kinase